MVQNTVPGATPQWVAEMNALGNGRRPFLFVIDYPMQQPLICPLDTIDPQHIMFDLAGFSNVPRDIAVSHEPLTFTPSPVSFDAYKVAFDKVMAELRYGNSFLLNLTCATPVRSNLDLKIIFLRSKAKYRLWLAGKCVVFSPEPFVKISDGRISTYPMKGTIDAAIPGAHELIMKDPKETAEHITIVDLLRNDLNRVATGVQVERFRYVEEVRTHRKTLLQVSSEISGTLSAGYHTHLGDIFFKLLPAGSVTGAPKRKTLEILQSAETHERGFFTGVFGYFDGARVESAVMIRYIEQQGDELVYKSGGGITTQSSAEEEYREMIDKVYVPVH